MSNLQTWIRDEALIYNALLIDFRSRYTNKTKRSSFFGPGLGGETSLSAFAYVKKLNNFFNDYDCWGQGVNQ